MPFRTVFSTEFTVPALGNAAWGARLRAGAKPTDEPPGPTMGAPLLNPGLIRGIVASRPGLFRYGLGGRAVESGTGGFVECWP